MVRTIVTIEERDGVLMAKLAKAGVALEDARRPYPLGCDPGTLPPLDTRENVKAYGEALRQALMQHPAISAALQTIFQTPAGTPRILCFEIDATEGERIRWEVLCDDKGNHLGLDARCQLGRIAEEVSTREGSVRPFVPPLRIAAFLSAAGVDAAPEWRGLATALAGARAAGLPVEAYVYVGQQELLDEIAAEVAGGSHPGVTVHPMPASGAEVEQRLNERPPHLVHFFCHGSAAFGAPYLELATVVEHDLKAATGTVVLYVDDMVNVEGLRDAWVVILNCCEGGKAVEGMHSMAHRVVARGGVPAAIGMQEPVAAGDANAFCASLYPEIFSALAAAMQAAPGSQPVAVNLTAAIGRPRRALRDRHAGTPANFNRWSLPVLYLHDQPLQVHRPAGPGLSPESVEVLRERAETVAGFLRALPPDTPDSVRDAMLATLDRPPAVPPGMRPDRSGSFATT